jgi:hypothetical protein
LSAGLSLPHPVLQSPFHFQQQQAPPDSPRWFFHSGHHRREGTELGDGWQPRRQSASRTRGRRARWRRASHARGRRAHQIGKPRECLRARRGMASRARVRRARLRKAGEVISASSPPPPCHQASNARTRQTLAVRLLPQLHYPDCLSFDLEPQFDSAASAYSGVVMVLWWCCCLGWLWPPAPVVGSAGSCSASTTSVRYFLSSPLLSPVQCDEVILVICAFMCFVVDLYCLVDLLVSGVLVHSLLITCSAPGWSVSICVLVHSFLIICSAPDLVG